MHDGEGPGKEVGRERLRRAGEVRREPLRGRCLAKDTWCTSALEDNFCNASQTGTVSGGGKHDRY